MSTGRNEKLLIKYFMKRGIFLFVLCFSFTVALSQISFEKLYCGILGPDGCFTPSVIQKEDNGYAFCSYGYAGSSNHFLLGSTNIFGDTILIKQFDGLAFCINRGIDGGFIISGYLDGASMLMKTDSNFEKEWQTKYTSSSTGFKVIETVDSGYCMIGNWSPGGYGATFLSVTKTNKNGNSLWIKYFGSYPEQFDARSVIQSPDSGFVICGTYRPVYGTYSYIFLLKINSMGDSVWMKTYRHSSYYSHGFEVMQNENNGYLAVGFDNIPDGPDLLFLVNTNENGDTVWTKTFDGIYHNSNLLSATKIRSGGYMIAGTSLTTGSRTQQVCLTKINENGDTIWTRVIGSYGMELPWSIRQTRDEGFIICGEASCFQTQYSTYLIKTDSLGHYSPSSIPDKNIGLAEVAFPNPVKDILYIDCRERVISVDVYTIDGRIVDNIGFNENGPMKYSINFSDKPAGVYILRLTTCYMPFSIKVIKRN